MAAARRIRAAHRSASARSAQPVRREQRSAASAPSVAVPRLHRPDYQIILWVGLLMLLGLVVMYAIGPQRANVLNSAHNTNYYTDGYFAIKQTVSLLLSISAFMGLSLVPFAWLRQKAGTLLASGFVLCALLFVLGNMLHVSAIAQCSLGACRWFSLGSLGSFQPAEMLKFGMLIYMALFLGTRMRQGVINDLHQTIIPMVIMMCAALFFVIFLQKDMGTGLALTAMVACMLVMSGMSWRWLAYLAAGCVALVLLLIVIAPHRMERVATFFQGDDHATSSNDDGYHIKNAKIALGTGGLFGLGIGNSIQATGYLPEAINDSVFAIIGETFGFVGAVVVLALFAALLLRLLRIAERLPDTTMRLVVAGVFGWLGAHVMLNVASMIGVFPLTGITLPLLSFGGTSMVFIAGALGLAFQLSRQAAYQPINEKETSHEATGSRRWIGRARYAGRRRH